METRSLSAGLGPNANPSAASFGRYKPGPAKLKSYKELKGIVIDILKDNGFSRNRHITESALSIASHPLDYSDGNVERRLAERFIDRVLPAIVGYVSHIEKERGISRKKTEHYFELISEFGEIFTKSLSHTYNPNPQIHERIETKFELYEKIIRRPRNLEFLLETESASRKPMISLASGLMRKSKYISRLFLASIAEAENLSNLSNDMPHITDDTTFGEIKNEMTVKMADMGDDSEICKMLNLRVHTLLVKYFSSKQEDRDAVKSDLKETVSEYPEMEFIRQFSKTGLVKVAHLYFKYMKSKLDVGALVSENIGRVHNELSNLTNLVLQSMYESAYKTLSLIYGAPTTKSSIIITGSNARKEFPFFDIDSAIVFMDHGTTQKGKAHKEFFDSLEVMMEAACEVTGHNFDSVMPRASMRSGTIDDYVKFINDSKDMMHMFAFTAYGAGSRSTAGEFMTRIRGLKYGEFREYLIKSIIQHSGALKSDDGKPNVKYGKGGLNNIWDLIKINKLSNRLSGDNNTLHQLMQLNIDEKKRDELVSSYKFLLALRIRLDLHYGRNNKDLPLGKELERFATSLGYTKKGRAKASSRLLSEFRMHTERVHEITRDSFTKIIPSHMCAEVVNGIAAEKLRRGDQLSTTETLRLFRDPEFDTYTRRTGPSEPGFSD